MGAIHQWPADPRAALAGTVVVLGLNTFLIMQTLGVAIPGVAGGGN